jgi:hypothetical protein
MRKKIKLSAARVGRKMRRDLRERASVDLKSGRNHRRFLSEAGNHDTDVHAKNASRSSELLCERSKLIVSFMRSVS